MRILKNQKLLKTYVIIMAILCLTAIGIYFSYALIHMETKEIKSIKIVTGTIVPELQVNGGENNTILVPANQETENYTITIKNTAPIRARINLYYKIQKLESALVYGYIIENSMLTENGEIFESGQSISYQVKFVNHSNVDRTVEIYADGGLVNGILEIHHAYLFENISNKGNDFIPEDTPMKEYINDISTEFDTTNPENPNNHKMFIFRHPIETQVQGWSVKELTDYRYIGADPDNYVTFNGETAGWRIIGVFTVENEKGEKEQRIKLMHSQGIGRKAWDSSNINDWANASLMKEINPDTGSTTYQWTEDTLEMIDATKWYLGGMDDYMDSTTGLASHFYGYERGTEVYSNRSINWIGKVGLIYPSDYGYATSGGENMTREQCLVKAMKDWANMECSNNDWIYKKNSRDQWTLLSRSDSSYMVYDVGSDGTFFNSPAYDLDVAIPVVYLISNIQLMDGSGTKDDPFVFTK